MNTKMLYMKEIIRKMFSKDENNIIFNKILDICL